MFSVLRRYWLLLGLMLATVVILFVFLHVSVRSTFLLGVKDYAISVAMRTAAEIPPGDINQINGPQDMTKEAFLRTQRLLLSIRQFDRCVQYVYVMRKSRASDARPGDFEYVVDLPVKDLNRNGVIDDDEKKTELPGTPYDASRFPALMGSVKEAAADDDVSPDPPYPDLLSAYAPIKDAEGKTVGIVGVDITAKSINQMMLSSTGAIILCGILITLVVFSIAFLYCGHRLSIEQIRQMNHELSEKNRKLEENLWLRNEFSRTIVHDMRNPLFVIWGYTELLAQSGTVKDREALDMLQLIGVQVDHMKGFLEDMLMLAKSEAGALLLNKTPVDIGPLIIESKENFAPLLKLGEVAIDVKLPEKTRLVELDRDLMSRVFDNLISNALKFSPKNSTITIILDYPENSKCARIRVCDEGSGISNATKEKLFTNFATGSVKPVSGKQVGLGLIFCKMAIDAHAGRIYAEDNSPKGCIMVVEIG